MKAILVLVAAVLAGGALATAPALGTSTTVVGIGVCAADGDHTRTAPAGTEIVLRIPWGAKSPGLVIDFLQDVTTTVLIDGVPVANADSFWSTRPQRFDFGFGSAWWTFWTYPTGVVLAPGETLSVSPELFFSHLLFDGVGFFGPGVFGSPGTCTITGV